MQKVIFTLLIVLFSGGALANVSPSFDCDTAKTNVEKAICREFGKYDSFLAETFKQKKSDPNFKKDYLAWLKSRNQCEKEGVTRIGSCLQSKYLIIFELLLNKYGGFSTPFVPAEECFRPFRPLSNGDEGFYAVRVISSIRGCGDLNLNLEKEETEKPIEIKFLHRKGDVYYYRYGDAYTIGVKFELKYVTSRKKREPTLVMTLVEAD